MRQGKVTHGFYPMAQGLTFPLLILRNHALFNMVAVNIAGWGYLIKMHIYVMPQFNMYAASPDIPSVTIPIQT